MKKASTIPIEKLELYQKLVNTNPNVERKGASLPYTSANGHMFSFLTATGRLVLRLPTAEREAFLKKYATKLCEQHGVVMQEYVEVPDALLEKTEELKHYFDLSHAYVTSLKPKPAAKRAKSAKS